MSGTKTGSEKAVKTVKERYGEGYWKSIGSLGGKRGKTGGFASKKIGEDGLTGKERASIAGSVGGKKSSRRSVKYYMFRGELQSVQYISEYLGITRGAVYARLKQSGKVE